MCLAVLHMCLYVYHKQEEGDGSPELELQMVMSYRMGAGNQS